MYRLPKRPILLVAGGGIVGVFCLIGYLLSTQNKEQLQGMHALHKRTGNEDTFISNSNKSDTKSDIAAESYARVEARMTKRRKSMREACAKHGLNKTMSAEEIYVKNPFLRTSLFYSDKYKLIMCQIPKCGSSNQAKFLVVIEGLASMEDSDKKGVAATSLLAEKKLSARRITNINEISKRIETYRKMVITREPFSRLLSAFRNKLYNNKRGDRYATLAQLLHERFRGESVERVTKVTKGIAPTITIGDFIMHLTDTKRDSQKDPHWNFFHRLCAPCLIDYDFIGHMETLDEDMEHVKKELGIEGVPFPASYNSFTDWDKVKQYYAPAHGSLINSLYKRYKLDYDIFGYPTPVCGDNICPEKP